MRTLWRRLTRRDHRDYWAGYFDGIEEARLRRLEGR